MACAICPDTRACEPCTVRNGGIPVVFECDTRNPGRFIRTRYCSGECAASVVDSITLCPVCKNRNRPYKRTPSSVTCEICETSFVPSTSTICRPVIQVGRTQPRLSLSTVATIKPPVPEDDGLRRCTTATCTAIYSTLFSSCPYCTPDENGDIRCTKEGCRIKYRAETVSCPRCRTPKHHPKRVHAACVSCTRKCCRGSVQCMFCSSECCSRCIQSSGFLVLEAVSSPLKPATRQAFCPRHSRGIEYLKCTSAFCTAIPTASVSFEIICKGCFSPMSQDNPATRKVSS